MGIQVRRDKRGTDLADNCAFFRGNGSPNFLLKAGVFVKVGI
jgi:hypothetical protein